MLEDCFVDQGADLRWLLEQWGLCFIVFEEEMEWGPPGHFARTVQEQKHGRNLRKRSS
jgi:hypothetical protein